MNIQGLTTSFPIDGLLPRLYSKEVINQEQKEAIQVKNLRSKKISFLFDEVIIPELEAGISTKYDNLIEVMKASDDSLRPNILLNFYKVIMYVIIVSNSVYWTQLCSW